MSSSSQIARSKSTSKRKIIFPTEFLKRDKISSDHSDEYSGGSSDDIVSDENESIGQRLRLNQAGNQSGTKFNNHKNSHYATVPSEQTRLKLED